MAEIAARIFGRALGDNNDAGLLHFRLLDWHSSFSADGGLVKCNFRAEELLFVVQLIAGMNAA